MEPVDEKNRIRKEPIVNGSVESVILELKFKARQNHVKAQVYFYLIISVIIAGFLIFIYAYRFTSNTEIDDKVKQARDFLQMELRKQERNIDSVKVKLERLAYKENFYENSYNEFVNGYYRSDDSAMVVEQKAERFDRVNNLFFEYADSLHIRDAFVPFAFETLDDSKVQNSQIAESIYKRNQILDSISAKYFEVTKTSISEGLKTSNYELYNLINTIATRFGSVIILLFLVQLLIRVFRYNTRLANFYTARANVLELYLIDPQNFEIQKLTASLSAEGLDMGISKNPTEQILELAKLYSNKTK